MNARWIDMDPSRYSGIRSGDYGPFPIGDHIHFVRFEITTHATGYHIEPGERTACGMPVPNWREDPKQYPIAGIVDCTGCISEMREALTRED